MVLTGAQLRGRITPAVPAGVSVTDVAVTQRMASGRAAIVRLTQAYYTGVDVGSYPIDIGREPGSGPPLLRQEFYAPNARGTLFVREATVRKLRVHVNGTYDLALDLENGEASVDLSAYLVNGVNVIQYNPVGHGIATVTVAVD